LASTDTEPAARGGDMSRIPTKAAGIDSVQHHPDTISSNTRANERIANFVGHADDQWEVPQKSAIGRVVQPTFPPGVSRPTVRRGEGNHTLKPG
jgi:hypothetical protein